MLKAAFGGQTDEEIQGEAYNDEVYKSEKPWEKQNPSSSLAQIISSMKARRSESQPTQFIDRLKE